MNNLEISKIILNKIDKNKPKDYNLEKIKGNEYLSIKEKLKKIGIPLKIIDKFLNSNYKIKEISKPNIIQKFGSLEIGDLNNGNGIKIYDNLIFIGDFKNYKLEKGIIYRIEDNKIKDSIIGNINGICIKGIGKENEKVGFFYKGYFKDIKDFNLDEKITVYKYIDLIENFKIDEIIFRKIEELEKNFSEEINKKISIENQREKKLYFLKNLEDLKNTNILNLKEINLILDITKEEKIYDSKIISLVLDPRKFSKEEIKRKLKNNEIGNYIDNNFSFEFLDNLFKNNPKIFIKNYRYYVNFLGKINEFLDKKSLITQKDKNNMWKIGGSAIFLDDNEKYFLIKYYGLTKYELENYSNLLNTKGNKEKGSDLFKRVLFESILNKIDNFSGKVYRGINFENEEQFKIFLKNLNTNKCIQNFTKFPEIAQKYTSKENKYSLILEVNTNKAKTIEKLGHGKSHYWFQYGTKFEILEINKNSSPIKIKLKTI